MQFQSDILGIPIDVPVINETTALGAAFLAALGIGDFNTLDEISDIWKLGKRYEPKISEDERHSLNHSLSNRGAPTALEFPSLRLYSCDAPITCQSTSVEVPYLDAHI